MNWFLDGLKMIFKSAFCDYDIAAVSWQNSDTLKWCYDWFANKVPFCLLWFIYITVMFFFFFLGWGLMVLWTIFQSSREREKKTDEKALTLNFLQVR